MNATETIALSLRTDPAHDGIAVVHFNRPGSSANLFDSPTLHELDQLLDSLGADSAVRAVVFVSDKPSVFIAGADLKELGATSRPETLIDLGQQTFNKLARMRCVTVAAIHGACAGGGLEFSLACDYRVASRHRSTKIGLPEVLIGLIPGWGGSTRLPRLIGLPAALDLILRGELMPAAKARKKGVVDALVHPERLLEAAREYARKGKPHRPKHFLSVPTAPLIARVAEGAARKKTRDHYPAALKAIEVVTASMRHSIPDSLAAEKKGILELAGTDACRNLIRLFFLQEGAKRRPAAEAKPVAKTAVIGAGVMGSGIAQWLSAHRFDVTLRDVSTEQLARGLKQAGKLYADAAKRGLMSKREAQEGLDRIHPAETEVPLRGVDLVIEAAVEKMELKKRIFAQLENLSRSETILATNTSALSVTELARTLRHPERVVGLHFFNPVHRMKLVEVVRSDCSSQTAVDTAVAFVQRIGKLPVVVRDRPGFLVNRILMPYLLEAVVLFERGAAKEEIDEAMLDFGMPMGPLRLLDEVGLDVAADVARTLSAAFPDRMPLPAALEKMKDSEGLGRKSGKGFYRYDKGHSPQPKPRSFDRTLQQRMVLLMLNESARCLEEEIVTKPGDVDFAMIMGTGFAPFRGGPLRYADSIGIGKVVEDLRRFSDSGEARFQPCELLLQMGAQGRAFYNEPL